MPIIPVIFYNNCRTLNPSYLKNIKKENFSVKICLVCKKPFSWRKKWAKDWDHVKYCSEKCKKNKNIIKEI